MAGNAWTLNAVDAESKLTLSCLVRGDLDLAQVVEEYASSDNEDDERRYGPATCTKVGKHRIKRQPGHGEGEHLTSNARNVSMRVGMRRFVRLTNAFSRGIEKHAAMVSLYTVHYNLCRIHQTLGSCPRWSRD